MTVGVLVLTLNDGMAKFLTESYPVGQVMALRGISIVVLMTGFFVFRGQGTALKVNNWGHQLLRGGFMTGSTFCFVTGLSLLPLADAIAIGFAAPILTTALAIFLLGETVGWRRWVAVLVGFSGVLIMVQPTGDAFRIAALAPLGAAFFGALRDVYTRRISTSESSAAILLVSVTMVTVAGFATWPLGWSPIQTQHLWMFAISGLLVGIAQYLMIEAFRLAEAALVAPFKFSSLLWAVIIGIVVWGDIPSPVVFVGALIVVASGLYILRREI